MTGTPSARTVALPASASVTTPATCVSGRTANRLRLVRDGGIADAKTIMLLQWAALHGPFSPETEDLPR